MDPAMSNCNWEKIEAFRSMSEFNRFVVWIERQLEKRECVEIIDDVDSAMPLQSRKFRCLSSDQIWLLSFPDPGYFKGSWGPL
jgi:hypothetical protein